MISFPAAILLSALALGDASQEQDASSIDTYPVHDLVTQRLDLDADPLKDTSRITPEEAAQRKSERLCRLIATFVEPSLDPVRHEIVEPILTHPEKKQILAIARADQRAWIAAFLDRCRNQADVPMLIEGRWLAAPDVTLRELQITSKPRVLSSAAEVEQLLARLQGTTVSRSMDIPSMTASTLDHLYFYNTHQIPYVMSYQQYFGVEPLKKNLIVPDVRFAHEGFKLGVDVALLADRQIGILLSIELLEVEHPIPSRETPLGPVAEPETRTTKIDASVVVPDGGALVVAVPSAERDGKVQAMVLRARITTEDELKQREAKVKSFPLK